MPAAFTLISTSPSAGEGISQAPTVILWGASIIVALIRMLQISGLQQGLLWFLSNHRPASGKRLRRRLSGGIGSLFARLRRLTKYVYNDCAKYVANVAGGTWARQPGDRGMVA